MVPQFNSNKVPNHQLVGDLSLLNELDASTKQHQDATMKLNTTVEELSRLISNIETDQQLSEHLVTLQKFIQINSHHVEQNSERLDKVIDLLQEGFRIGSRYHNSND